MRPRRPLLAAAAACAMADAGDARAAAAPLAPYYDRVLMGEAGARCGLFSPGVMGSLRVGAAQARSAALAAHAPVADVNAARARATAKARAVACDNPDLRIAAQRVRGAFMSWSHQPRLDLPGRGGGWTAERAWLRGPRWTLSTRAALEGAPLAFGLVRLDGVAPALAADAAWPQAARASAARLVLRDAARAPDPYLGADGQPPAQASVTFLAESRQAAPKGLLPAGVLFRFPPAAEAAMAGLDGRENVRLELVLPSAGRDRVVSALLPVGDFATGRAFLAAGP